MMKSEEIEKENLTLISKFMQLFKVLDLSIANMSTKTLRPRLQDILTAMEFLCGHAVLSEDIEDIIYICPECFEAKWEYSYSRSTYHLTICSLRIHPEDLTFCITQRLEYFRQKLLEIDNISEFLVNRSNGFPPMPTDRKRTNPSLIVSKLGQEYEETRKRRAIEEITMFSGKGMDGLRDLAMKRELDNKTEKENAKVEEERNILELRKESLRNILDIIRHLQIHTKRNRFESSEVEKLVCKSLGISSQEARYRIQMISSNIPEYIITEKGDQICSKSVIVVSNRCNYGAIRKRL